jgi:hypothetical protein
MPTRKGYTQIEFPKELAAILVIESRRLGFGSVAAYVEILNKVRLKKAWSGLDLQILAEYGKLPETTIMTESELKAKGYVKVSEFTEQGPKVEIPVKKKTFSTSDPEKFQKKLAETDFGKDEDVTLNYIPKKPRKPKKKTESTKFSMPTTERFFDSKKEK